MDGFEVIKISNCFTQNPIYGKLKTIIENISQTHITNSLTLYKELLEINMGKLSDFLKMNN